MTPRQETRKTTGNSTVFDRLYGNRSTKRGERSSLEEHKTPNPKDSKYSPGGVRHSSGRHTNNWSSTWRAGGAVSFAEGQHEQFEYSGRAESGEGHSQAKFGSSGRKAGFSSAKRSSKKYSNV